MELIVNARIEEVRKDLLRSRLYLEVTGAAKRYFERNGWSPISGVQELEKLFRKELIRPVADLLLNDRIHDEWRIIVHYQKSSKKIHIEPAEPAAVIQLQDSTSDEHSEYEFESPSNHTNSLADDEGTIPEGFDPPTFDYSPECRGSAGPSRYRGPKLQLLPQKLI